MKNIVTPRSFAFLLTAAVLGIALLFGVAYAAGTFATTPVTVKKDVYENHTFLVATTTTATSTNSNISQDQTFVIAGAEHVAFVFQRGDTSGTGNSGSTNFKVQVTRDLTAPVTWYDYPELVDGTTTAATIYSSVNLTGTSTSQVYMENLGWYAARCIAVETTDGEHSCYAQADF